MTFWGNMECELGFVGLTHPRIIAMDESAAWNRVQIPVFPLAWQRSRPEYTSIFSNVSLEREQEPQ